MNRLAGLDAHAQRLAGTSLAALIEADPARARDFALRVGPLYANFARQRYDRIALDALFALAAEADLAGAMQRQLDGEIVNSTEGRAALHTALRGGLSLAAAGPHAQARRARERMQALVASLQASAVTDVVSVGIGGSDLGPRLVVDALAPANARLRVHFISNVDGNAARRVLAPLDPARTAAIVISKTFGTQETLLNGRIVRDWLGEGAAYHGGRLYAVSANVERAGDFGIPPERILPMWDWVGGRYSLWSAVGFPIALAIGMEAFEALLDGAAAMDAHANEAPLRENLAVLHALTAVWNRNGLHAATQAVLPYDDRLRLLPNYLQQLVMESLGKSVRTSACTRCRCGGAVPVPIPSTASSRPCTRAPRRCPPISSGWSAPSMATPTTTWRCWPTCWRRWRHWRTARMQTIRTAVTPATAPAPCCCWMR